MFDPGFFLFCALAPRGGNEAGYRERAGQPGRIAKPQLLNSPISRKLSARWQSRPP